MCVDWGQEPKAIGFSASTRPPERIDPQAVFVLISFGFVCFVVVGVVALEPTLMKDKLISCMHLVALLALCTKIRR